MALNKWGGLNKWGISEDIITGTIVAVVNATISESAQKLAESSIQNIIDEVTTLSASKDTSGTLSQDNTCEDLSQGQKLVSEVILETLSAAQTLSSFKLGLSAIQENLNSSIIDRGVKASEGTIDSSNLIQITVTGSKIDIGVVTGTITLDIPQGISVSGNKEATGVLSESFNIDTLLTTLKLLDGAFTQENISSVLPEGYKSAEGVVQNTDAISDIVVGEKVSPGSFILIDHSNDINTAGTKNAEGSLVDVRPILIALLAETLRSGDIDTSNAITTILSGVNTESTHITRVNAVLGTVNLRYNPIIGIVDQEAVLGTI